MDNFYSDYAECFEICMLTLPESVISMEDVEGFCQITLSNQPQFTDFYICNVYRF